MYPVTRFRTPLPKGCWLCCTLTYSRDWFAASAGAEVPPHAFCPEGEAGCMRVFSLNTVI